MITSTANDKVKAARSLARKKDRVASRQFLAEGTRLVGEAIRAGFSPALGFYERAAFDRDPQLRQIVVKLEKQRREIYEVSATVMRALTETETPQGLAAVLPLPQLQLPVSPRLTLVLDRVRDPGNLGTMLRTAWAAHCDSVWLAPETADPYNPKVVRAGMGAHFHIPILTGSWDEIARYLATTPRIYLAEADGAIDYARADWSAPLALIVGGEAEGASADARRLATTTLTIPMPGQAESLNAAVAAGILLFEAVRASRDSIP